MTTTTNRDSLLSMARDLAAHPDDVALLERLADGMTEADAGSIREALAFLAGGLSTLFKLLQQVSLYNEQAAQEPWQPQPATITTTAVGEEGIQPHAVTLAMHEAGGGGVIYTSSSNQPAQHPFDGTGPCPECEGRGSVDDWTADGGNPGRRDTCPKCKGLGRTES